ncbi:alpha/beta hydrolase [Zobellella sp. DQSA1]|uniref:alpha/beta hydrolase n=1 Tax=Zobellella sp. DQSA1 TaxID=3342386 RepID=UPI0035C1F544
MMNIKEFCDGRYPVTHIGEKINTKNKVVILLHGRRQSVEDIFNMAEKLGFSRVSWLLPCAPEKTWYPHGFLRPLNINQPYLDDALSCIDYLIELLSMHGVERRNIIIMGFSQGACIGSQYLASFRRKLGGALLFTGGLFGPEVSLPIDEEKALLNMPIFITGSATDSWVPASRIIETTRYFRSLGAEVKEVVFENRDHLVSDLEIEMAKKWLSEYLELHTEEKSHV